MTDQEVMWQTAPYPENLKIVVDDVDYLDWALNLDFYEREVGGEGLTLRIRLPMPDSREPDGPAIFWIHDFEVPARVYDLPTWTRWVFDCIMLCHRHEAMEAFRVAGEQVFFPAHDVFSDMYETKHVVHRRSIG